MPFEFGGPCVFLDRDGVLIEDRRDYVRRWEDVEIFPQAAEGCRRLVQGGFALVVVTNQALVGRGYLDLDEVQRIHQRIIDRFAEQGAPILASYICPHRPEDDCDCRKPKPGMILMAAREHCLDLSSSFLVGDNLRDLEAAAAATVAGILVRTGKGAAQEALLDAGQKEQWPVYTDLLGAAEAILQVKAARC